MKKGRIAFAAVVIALFLFALFFGMALYITRTGAYAEDMGKTISLRASELLGVPVAVDGVRIESAHRISLEGIRVQDKAGEELAHAAAAEVD